VVFGRNAFLKREPSDIYFFFPNSPLMPPTIFSACWTSGVRVFNYFRLQITLWINRLHWLMVCNNPPLYDFYIYRSRFGKRDDFPLSGWCRCGGSVRRSRRFTGALIPLACAKVPVKVDGNKYTMHHKVIVIDDSIVIFTKSTDTVNDDNVIVVYDPAVAKQYLEEYMRVNSSAKDPNPDEINCP
jgi:phosphatidylserine/phosphatidylglycerophosphate/cardiolipin synthase-like enzyme